MALGRRRRRRHACSITIPAEAKSSCYGDPQLPAGGRPPWRRPQGRMEDGEGPPGPTRQSSEDLGPLARDPPFLATGSHASWRHLQAKGGNIPEAVWAGRRRSKPPEELSRGGIKQCHTKADLTLGL